MVVIMLWWGLYIELKVARTVVLPEIQFMSVSVVLHPYSVISIIGETFIYTVELFVGM